MFSSPSTVDEIVSSESLVDNVLVESGTNISIGCPGMTRNTFVVQIEWICVGVCGSTKKLPRKTVHSLLKYVKDQGTSVYKNKRRLRLDQDLFALEFDPVTSLDAGEYKCLINNRPSPEARINLKVLGETKEHSFLVDIFCAFLGYLFALWLMSAMHGRVRVKTDSF